MYEVHKLLNNLCHATLIPGILTLLWLYGLITITSLKLCLTLSIIIFVIIPIIFKYSVTLQRGILFLTFIAYPRNLDYTKPNTVGLYGTRNFYVEVDEPDKTTLRIGVWHTLPIQIVKLFSKELQLNPEELEDAANATEISDPHSHKMEPILKSEFPVVTEANEKLFYERMLRQPGTIVLYLHGNTASRASGHRIELYKVLRGLGYHVISLDYRSYGDSDKISPTEEGVVRDALSVYNYIRNLTNNPVFLWGHSLGTGVSTHFLALLNKRNIPGPRAVVLESPFTNIRDEVRKHPFAKLFRHLPWFDYTIANPMYENCLRFESDQHISEFRQPVLILHAEDDLVVPFHLGYKLYRSALDNRGRSWGPVEFHRFEGTSKYGHKYLCRSPDLPKIVKKFFDTYRDEIY